MLLDLVSLCQKQIIWSEWIASLPGKSTKKTFSSLFASYVKSGKPSLFYPTTVNDEKSRMLSEEFVCNHEEVDTRMIYHASLQEKNDVAFVANGSDVYFLRICACVLDSNRNW